MHLTVHTLNAFAKTPNGGNPAGVLLEADGLTEDQMLAVAKVVGFSETAFVQKSDQADFKVRFFTPSSEVDLCGHATIGTFYLMAHKQLVVPGSYSQETKAGVLAIEVLPDDTVFMEQKPPVFSDVLDPAAIADSLNTTIDSFSPDLPIQIVSTGLRDIFIPVRSLEVLTALKPDFAKVREVSRQHNVIGYHLFTLETLFGSTAHCRNLAPLYDIDEEAATGTSSGALSCYLYKYDRVTAGQVSSLVFEQGYSMNRPSEIRSQLEMSGDEVTRVRVGGVAADIQERKIDIPR